VTREDIIRMAREAGAGEPESLYGRTDYVVMTWFELERFAALVAEAEREACRQACKALADAAQEEAYYRGHMECEAAIRARGSK
jgi:hypothetical protein